MKLTPDARAERAIWLCEALQALEEHAATTKEMLKERRLEAEGLRRRIAQLQREVATGETDAVQLTIEGA